MTRRVKCYNTRQLKTVKMPLEIEKLVKLYTTIASTSSLNNARIMDKINNQYYVQSKWTQRNLDRKTNQRFQLNQIISADLKNNIHNFPMDVTTEVLSAISWNDEFKAILRQILVDNTKKECIEIWNKQKLLKHYDLSAMDVHGDVYADVEFSSFEWSPDNKQLLYIAEKKLPKSVPFYQPKSSQKKDEKETIPGNEYVFKPHWGEQLVGKHRPAVFVLDIETDVITPLPEVPSDLSPGQVLWTKDRHIVGVVWQHEPRYLGLTACTNRNSWIFLWKDGAFYKLSSDGCAVHSPRISPDGKHLIWLERKAGGPHHNAHRLMLRNMGPEMSHNHVIVDIVQTSQLTTNNKEFYGIYHRLPQRCWGSDKHIFFSTSKKSQMCSYVVNILTKSITEINNDETSLSVLDVKDNTIIFSNTSLIQPTRLMIAEFNDDETLCNGSILKFPLSFAPPSGRDKLKYEANDYVYSNDEPIKQFNYIYFGPKGGDSKSVPVLIIPHGGPHSSYVNAFSTDFTFFALAGFALVLVNYRGSTGMGAATVEYLQGKVGDVDVKDCLTAMNEALAKYPWLDPDCIGLCGGSHGGFIVTHLSGQFPDLFKAVVARNPVIDISTMFSTSDIPDCRNALTKEEKIAYRHDVCAAITDFPYDFSESRNSEMFLKMIKCSPIAYVDSVKAPTLISIGTNDLRVPSFQGKLWYYRLKVNKVKTKLLVYEDNHQLSNSVVEIDHIINDFIWLFDNMLLTKDLTLFSD